MAKPMLTAHTGCEGTLRGSFESLVVAVECGATAVEIDVRMDRKGFLRLSHDKMPDQAAYDQCVLLDTAFNYIATHELTVNCDMKEPGLIHDVIAAARRHGIPRERLWITGAITPMQLINDPALVEKAMFFLNIEEIFKYLYLQECGPISAEDFKTLVVKPWTFTRPWMPTLAERMPAVHAILQASGAEGLNLPYKGLEESGLAAMADANIPVSIWTVDDEDVARRLLGCKNSIVNLTTRELRLLQRFLAD